MSSFTARFIAVAKLISVEPYMFFCLFGYIMRLVSYQDLLMDRACRNWYSYSDETCDNLVSHETEQKKSIELGNNLYTGVVLMGSLPSVIVVIFIGPWSDKYTRRWPLIISAAGMFIESVCSALLTTYKYVSPIYYPFVALIAGVLGGYLGASSYAASYLSDITDPRSRASRFAILDFFLIFGNILGTVIGGQVYKILGYMGVMGLAPVLFFCALMYAIFALKETKPPVSAIERKEMFKDLLTLDNIKQSYNTCMRKRFGNIRLQIWLLVWIDTTFRLVHMGTIAIGFAYAKSMYNMGVTEYSNANTLFSSFQAILTVVSVPLLSKKLLLHEAAIGMIGEFSLMAKMVLLSVAFSVPLFYFAMFSGAVSSTIGIAVRSRLSKLVSKEELGRAFSLLGIFNSVAPLLGTTLFFQIYNASLDSYTGLMYMIAATILLPSTFIFVWMTKMPTISVGDYAQENDSSSLDNPSHYSTLREDEKF